MNRASWRFVFVAGLVVLAGLVLSAIVGAQPTAPDITGVQPTPVQPAMAAQPISVSGHGFLERLVLSVTGPDGNALEYREPAIRDRQERSFVVPVVFATAGKYTLVVTNSDGGTSNAFAVQAKAQAAAPVIEGIKPERLQASMNTQPLEVQGRLSAPDLTVLVTEPTGSLRPGATRCPFTSSACGFIDACRRSGLMPSITGAAACAFACTANAFDVPPSLFVTTRVYAPAVANTTGTTKERSCRSRIAGSRYSSALPSGPVTLNTSRSRKPWPLTEMGWASIAGCTGFGCTPVMSGAVGCAPTIADNTSPASTTRPATNTKRHDARFITTHLHPSATEGTRVTSESERLLPLPPRDDAGTLRRPFRLAHARSRIAPGRYRRAARRCRQSRRGHHS